ncbi:hypothetical protein EQM14_01675 [Caproiciproducens sp. NJN-50]|uniref:hypothetical protein n=1 Tax=Caproiciproducens sp. NJN-50 TaxID=2507162 RepID=UPI000FFDFDE4|nr:hypothetical protein [Caproiciproducens sp. NJN-50]QAT48593.1 hypothetical protein EQM14_01675 [Caproiciproducens sp. NJN-50]
MTFHYYVSFGGFSLYAVESVQDKNGRDLETYDGVGAGKFNVPNAKDPETWSIQCQLYENATEASKYNQWRASEIFNACKSLLGNTTDPSRLVITNIRNSSANLSVLAWFKSYDSQETSPGVYTVTFELEEYKPVGVKTTNIPTVARPGKVPTPPKVTLSSSNTAYKNYKKTGVGTKTDAEIYKSKAAIQEKKHDYLTLKSSGKPVTNAATVKPGTIYAPKTVNNISPYSGATGNSVSAKAQLQGVAAVVSGAGTAIKNAYYDAVSWLDKKLNG